MAIGSEQNDSPSPKGMASAKLGTGPEVSRLGLGTWAIGGPYQFGWGPVDDNDSIAAILHAVDRGISWVDTAPAYGYGHAESILGDSLRSVASEDRPLIFTKCGRTWTTEGEVRSDLRPESIRQQCEESLTRLGVDVIDLYQIHRPDRETGTPIEDSWAAMAELVDEGLVRWIGVSNFDLDLLDRCERVRHIDSLQPLLNVIDRRDVGLLDWCSQRDTGVVAYSPLASGLLSGSFERDHLPADDWRKNSPKFSDEDLKWKSKIVDGLANIAERLDVRLPEIAVSWVLHQTAVTGAIVGARRPSQIDGWVTASQLELTQDDLDEIEQVFSLAVHDRA